MIRFCPRLLFSSHLFSDPGTLPPEAVEQLEQRMSDFTVVTTVADAKPVDIPGVLCVQSAMVRAATSLPMLRQDKETDVTAEVCALLDPCTGVLNLSR